MVVNGGKMSAVGDSVTKFPSSVPVVVGIDELDVVRGNSKVVLADVRWYLDGRNARDAYATGRLPGAVFVDVDRDLARESDDATDGRHPFPSPADFAASMSRLGIGDDTYVVAYDDTGGMTASRFVVMLRMIGHPASLLDGGINAWTAAGRRLDSGRAPQTPRAEFTPSPWPRHRRVTKVDLAGLVHDGPSRLGVVLLDARSTERFLGTAGEAVARLDPRPGHIPGARSAPWNAVVDGSTGELKPVDELRRHFKIGRAHV